MSHSTKPGSAFPALLHTAEYGEVIGVLMLEEEKRLAELVDLQKVAMEWRFGCYLVSGVALVLLMLSLANRREVLGGYVSELWIDHYDPSQGPEASLLRRLATGCPTVIYLYNSQAQVVKRIYTDPPPLLRSFATTAVGQVALCEPWSPDRFNKSKIYLQNRFSLEHLWSRGTREQIAILRSSGELVPIVYDPPEAE